MGVEGREFGWGPPHQLETATEQFGRLRIIFDRFTLSGGVDNLEALLRQAPQRDEQGNLLYLLTSGLAVELITGFQRKHHDLDVVVLNPANTKMEHFGTDIVTPGQYWADMQFTPRFLETTARKVWTRKEGGVVVETVHPAILLVQKCSNAFGRAPRQKDKEDVAALVHHWKQQEHMESFWYKVISHSLAALPGKGRSETEQRIVDAINHE